MVKRIRNTLLKHIGIDHVIKITLICLSIYLELFSFYSNLYSMRYLGILVKSKVAQTLI